MNAIKENPIAESIAPVRIIDPNGIEPHRFPISIKNPGTAHSRTSKIYDVLPTSSVLDRLKHDLGLVPVDIRQAGVRDNSTGRDGFQKHSVTLRHFDDLYTWDGQHEFIHNTIPQVIISNAFDGSSSWILDSGLFRLACSNGLVIKIEDTEICRIRHVGCGTGLDVVDSLINLTSDSFAASKAKIDTIEEWKALPAPQEVRERIALRAHQLRYPVDPEILDVEDLAFNNKAPITPNDLLNIRRTSDQEENLWNTFNVVQENVTKGGIVNRTKRYEAKRNRKRYVKPREIKSIDADLRINRELCGVAEKAAEHLKF